MAKKFMRTTFSQQEIGAILKTGIGVEQIVYIEADRGPHFEATRLRRTKDLRIIFGPRPTADLLYLATERALDKGATMHVVRLLHLTDPTDIGTLTAVASSVDVPQRVAGETDEYGFFINELGVAGDNFSVIVEDGTVANTFKATLTSSETNVDDEVYDDLSVKTTDARYFLTVLNNNNPGRLRGVDDTPAPTPVLPDELPVNATYPLIGGSNGTALNDGSVIGDAGAITGIHGAAAALQNPNVIFGHQNILSTPAVVAAGLAYGELADIFVLQEPPDQTDTADAIDFRNGVGIYSHSKFDSSFGSLTYGQPKIFDVVQGFDVFIPTVGEIAPMLARAHDESIGGGFWLASAGGVRGTLSADVLGISDDVGVPTRSVEADALVAAGLNPIATQSGVPTHWGNQTMKADPTSLLVNQHVQVALISIRRITKASFDKNAFQPQSPKHWLALFLRTNPILERLEAKEVFAAFRYLGDQFVHKVDDQDLLEVNDVADIALGIYKVELWFQFFSANDNELGVEMFITSTAINFEDLFQEAA